MLLKKEKENTFQTILLYLQILYKSEHIKIFP